MEIHATDGKIGKLDELIMDPKNEEVTHILMKEGHLWGKKDMVIPISAVKSAFSGVIILNLDKKGVEKVPTLPLKH
jgi:sporulation protein YlmC with PRC-barrel domain